MQRRLAARVGADQQADVGLLDAGDRRVEQIAAARAWRIEPGTVLAAVDVRRCPEPLISSLTSDHRLAVDEVADDRTRSARRRRPRARSRIAAKASRQVGRLQLAVALDHRHVEPALLQAVIGRSGSCRRSTPRSRPRCRRGRIRMTSLPRASTRMLQPTASSDVDRFGLAQLPGPRAVLVGLGVQRADRAEVDDVARQLGRQRALDPGARSPCARRGRSAPSSSTPATSVMKRMQRVQWMQRVMWVEIKRPELLVGHRPLVLGEARMVRARRTASGPAGRTRRPGRRSGSPAGG